MHEVVAEQSEVDPLPSLLLQERCSTVCNTGHTHAGLVILTNAQVKRRVDVSFAGINMNTLYQVGSAFVHDILPWKDGALLFARRAQTSGTAMRGKNKNGL